MRTDYYRHKAKKTGSAIKFMVSEFLDEDGNIKVEEGTYIFTEDGKFEKQ
jgi:hypothetical protein